MKTAILAAAAVALMLVFSSGATARTSVAVQNWDNIQVVRADNAVLTGVRVRQAIVGAMQQGKWIILTDEPGRLVATFNIRNKHSLTVEVRYSGTHFSVIYQDSSNLNFAQGPTEPIIHPAYNQQAKALVYAINAGLQRV